MSKRNDKFSASNSKYSDDSNDDGDDDDDEDDDDSDRGKKLCRTKAVDNDDDKLKKDKDNDNGQFKKTKKKDGSSSNSKQNHPETADGGQKDGKTGKDKKTDKNTDKKTENKPKTAGVVLVPPAEGKEADNNKAVENENNQLSSESPLNPPPPPPPRAPAGAVAADVNSGDQNQTLPLPDKAATMIPDGLSRPNAAAPIGLDVLTKISKDLGMKFFILTACEFSILLVCVAMICMMYPDQHGTTSGGIGAAGGAEVLVKKTNPSKLIVPFVPTTVDPVNKERKTDVPAGRPNIELSVALTMSIIALILSSALLLLYCHRNYGKGDIGFRSRKPAAVLTALRILLCLIGGALCFNHGRTFLFPGMFLLCVTGLMIVHVFVVYQAPNILPLDPEKPPAPKKPPPAPSPPPPVPPPPVQPQQPTTMHDMNPAVLPPPPPLATAAGAAADGGQSVPTPFSTESNGKAAPPSVPDSPPIRSN